MGGEAGASRETRASREGSCTPPAVLSDSEVNVLAWMNSCGLIDKSWGSSTGVGPHRRSAGPPRAAAGPALGPAPRGGPPRGIDLGDTPSRRLPRMSGVFMRKSNCSCFLRKIGPCDRSRSSPAPAVVVVPATVAVPPPDVAVPSAVAAVRSCARRSCGSRNNGPWERSRFNALTGGRGSSCVTCRS